ncbi:MAG: hypothetical protein Tsb0013_16050 [Phycisphaerales bacterium]
MDAERYERLGRAFDAALDAPAHLRDEAIARACAGDERLERSVRLMLIREAAADHGPFADRNIDDSRRAIESAMSSEAAAHPTTIGPYHVIRELGRGGMGVVYECDQAHPSRRVAVKVLRSGWAGRKLARRLEREAEILGRLHHPGIASVYDAGLAEAGGHKVPFVAMELVEGEPLDVFAARTGLDTRARLKLLERVAEAIDHAHRKGVIHRDLKPQNILVDATGSPKVLDFGVARVTDADIAVTTMHTEVGTLIGTLAYMAPEQARGDLGAVDTRSDVYALGAILYELLAGRPALDLERTSVPGAIRAITEDAPDRLSMHDRTLRGDVDTIVAKAIEKAPERRYQSAGEFASDIRRFLDNRQIVARPPSRAYALRKFVARNRALSGAIAAALLILILGTIGTSITALWALDEREAAIDAQQIASFRAAEAQRANEQARREAEVALETSAFLESVIRGHTAGANALQSGVTLAEVLKSASASIGDRFEGRPAVEASIRNALGRAFEAMLDGESAGPEFCRCYELSKEAFGPDDPRTVEAARTAVFLGCFNPEERVKIAKYYYELSMSVEQHKAQRVHTAASYWFALDASGRHEESLAMARDYFEHPETGKDWLAPMVAGSLHERGLLKEALEWLRRYSSYPGSSGLEGWAPTMDDFRMALKTLRAAGRMDEARALVEHLPGFFHAEIEPNLMYINQFAARFLFESGQVERAFALLERTSQLHKRWPKAQRALDMAEFQSLVGACHAWSGRNDDAEEAFRSAIDASDDPDRREALADEVQIWRALGVSGAWADPALRAIIADMIGAEPGDRSLRVSLHTTTDNDPVRTWEGLGGLRSAVLNVEDGLYELRLTMHADEAAGGHEVVRGVLIADWNTRFYTTPKRLSQFPEAWDDVFASRGPTSVIRAPALRTGWFDRMEPIAGWSEYASVSEADVPLPIRAYRVVLRTEDNARLIINDVEVLGFGGGERTCAFTPNSPVTNFRIEHFNHDSSATDFFLTIDSGSPATVPPPR